MQQGNFVKSYSEKDKTGRPQKKKMCCTWWCTPVIPTLRRLRRKVTSSRPTWAIY
jgi:hypothetical protein